jgi:signal transduction histidine kinase
LSDAAQTNPRPPAAVPDADVPQQRGPRTFTVAWAAAYAALLALLLWSRTLSTPLLIVAALAALTALGQLVRMSRVRPRDPATPHLYAATILLFAGLLLGGGTALRLHEISANWESLVRVRNARLRSALAERMQQVIQRGHATAQAAAGRIERSPGTRAFDDLEAIRVRTGVEAIVMFDTIGEVIAWSGEHRGLLPQSIRRRPIPLAHEERPLFSYLYFGAPVRGRGAHVVVAELLQTGLPPESATTSSITDAFTQAEGVRPRFAPGPGRNAVWNLAVSGDTLLHATFPPMTQQSWRSSTAATARTALLALVAAALLILCAAWLRGSVRGRPSAVPLSAAAIALAVAPIGAALGLERMFSPALFVVPVLSGDISLGALLAILLPIGALVATSRPVALNARMSRLAIALGSVLVALGFVLALRIILAGTSGSLLEGGSYLWAGLQTAAVLLLTIIAGLALPVGRDNRAGPGLRTQRVALIGAIVIAFALSCLVLLRVSEQRSASLSTAALWAVPFALFAIGLSGYLGPAGRLARWVAAGWLAATAVLPQLWGVHVEARLKAAERELSTLGTRPDPYLDYLLRQFAVDLQRRHASGDEGVQLVYRSWEASGLSGEPYPTRIALWDPAGRPTVDLALGDVANSIPRLDSLPMFLRIAMDSARALNRTYVQVVQGRSDVNQSMAVPLANGYLVTVIVPPRRQFARASVLAPFLGGESGADARLNVIPAKLGEPSPPREVRWRPRENGYRSETVVRYPEGDYHAHLELLLPSVWVRLARGALLVAFDMAVLLLLWLIGRAARGEPVRPPGGVVGWLRGFRARVTVALFVFFLLPTILFGLVAYRALAGEVERAAHIIAEHAAEQAARDFLVEQGDLRALAAHAGEEILYFHNTGELLSASSPEALELGLFNAWMPRDVYDALQSGEEVSVVEQHRLADYRYVAAYQRLAVTGMIAVPVSLLAGETAARQRELAHLILFAALVGGLLSLALSVAVARALARPIGQLRRAATAVGAGQFRVHLPENRPDEFGDLFASFNRMTRRLRRARAQELRTARVLAWGEMARQIAHEIKNPLTPIKLSVQHLRRAYGDSRPDFGQILKTNVDQILKEIDSLAEIARAFSRYGAPSAAGPLEPVDVASVVHEALTLYRAGDSSIAYEEAVQPALPRVQARSGELKEVIINLLENARNALDGAGRVVMTATHEDSGIELCVQDSGPGIPPELLPRIFEPHFSTNSAGTGLGLAIVRRLVESWDGTVTAESEPGKGTTIRIRMVVAPEWLTGVRGN